MEVDRLFSKPELKYRSKLFAERYYTKEEQRAVDNFIGENYGCTYKQLYIEHRHGFGRNGLFAGIAMNRLSKRFTSVGIAVKDATGEFRKTVDILTEASKQWQEVNDDEKDKIVDAFNNCL